MGAGAVEQTRETLIISVPIHGDFLRGRARPKYNEIKRWRAKDETKGAFTLRGEEGRVGNGEMRDEIRYQQTKGADQDQRQRIQPFPLPCLPY